MNVAEDDGSRSGGEASSLATPAAAGILIKREPVDETDIKDFAETTMNELLGWYGYGKVDSRDTQGLNLHRFTASGSPTPHDEDGEGGGGGVGRPDAPSPTNSSNEATANNGSAKVADPVNLPPGYIVCAWCQKVGMKLFTLKTATGQKAFCSELCFTQCRRASFKKNKVCDWCKHIRHTVNYVDFQDGEQQLQFCSNKCLNQYKMNIFCRETQAHLQMHPHLQDAAKLGGPSGSTSSGTSGGSVTLITPDLWLRDCHGTTHESPSSTGINGHDGKGGGDATLSPQQSVEEDEEPISLGVVRGPEESHRHSRKSFASSSSITGIKDRSKVSRHNSRFRDKHKRYRGFHKTRSSASASTTRALNVGIVEPPNPTNLNATNTNSSLTSPKSSSGQLSPNVPVSASAMQQVLGNSPLSASSGTATISPHPPSLPPQLLAAAVAAAAAAANNQQHPHPPMLPPELTRPPFVPPPLGPHYPFLGQPPADMLLRLPHGGVRPPTGNGVQPPQPPPPFLFPPGMGFPFGLQGPPPPPGSGNGSSQANPGAQPPPTHNPLINPLLSSLLPPVAVMVPYPVVIPIPVPIPIPLPFPVPTPDFFKKMAAKNEESKDTVPPSSTALSAVRVPNPLSSFATAMVAVTSSGSTVATRDSLHNSRPASKGSTNVSRLARHLHTNSISHLAGTSSAKRVDSVITRLVAPKLTTQAAAAARGLSTLDATQALSLTSSALTTTSSITTAALASTTMPSSLHESSSDQSNGLDDSSDISDFPDSDAFDLEGAESEDSRLSEGALRISGERSRTFCPVPGPSSSLSLLADSGNSRTSPPSSSTTTTATAAAAFPALPSRERREERDTERHDVSRVENSLSREPLDSTSVEPEMKRKCLRARLTAK